MIIAPHAHISILHAFEVPFESRLHTAGVDNKLLQTYKTLIQAQKKKEMQQFISELEASGSSLTGITENGAAFEVIRQQMEALQPDLVVIGKHGQAEGEEMLLGSVTRRVIHDADCDVLVVG